VKMRLLVLKSIKLKKAGRLFDISPGGIVEIKDPRKAQHLIQAGYVKPLPPPDQAGKPVAAKIYSHILQDTVWLALDPSFVGDGDGIPVYTIEELRMLKGADEGTIKLLHACKKEVGGVLVLAREL